MKVAYKDQKVVNVRKGHVAAWVEVNGTMQFIVMKKLDHKEVKFKSQTVAPKSQLWVDARSLPKK